MRSRIARSRAGVSSGLASAMALNALLQYLQREEATLQALQFETVKGCLQTGHPSKHHRRDPERERSNQSYCRMENTWKANERLVILERDARLASGKMEDSTEFSGLVAVFFASAAVVGAQKARSLRCGERV